MKRIALCADGTWNIRDQVDRVTKKRRPSNVTKVARAVLAHVQQAREADVAFFRPYDRGLRDRVFCFMPVN
jgi:Uncharacterized alpha/beta hydrolase domain (DUF2235)